MWSPLLILAAAVWAGPRVLVEVDLGPLELAPVAEVASTTERVELSCRDDGQGADAQANDAVHTCAGSAPEGAARLTVRWGSGQQSLEQAIDADLALRLGPSGFGPLQVRPPKAQELRTQGPSSMPEPGQGQGWWGLFLGLLAAGGVGFWLWPKGVRGASWSASSVQHRSGDLGELLGTLQAPVLIAGQAELSAPELPGPALFSESQDVDHLLGTLRDMRRAHPALPLTLLILDREKLTAPGEIGLSMQERLQRDAPPGTTLVIWEP
ncbi:MAG: hypothetical protein ACI9VR_000316 [Cognaticolwellia sp.]|jgi:hypothetical protein